MSDKDGLVTYLNAQISASALTVNAGKIAAKYTVMLEASAESIVRTYLKEQKRDVVFAVGRIREDPDRIRADNVPRCVTDYLTVNIYSISKETAFVDGDALRELAYAELKRIFVASSVYRLFSIQDEDRKLDKQQVFNSVFTVLKLTES